MIGTRLCRRMFILAALLSTVLLPRQAQAQRHGSGKLVGWGDNTFGQTSAPAGLSWVTAIAAGAFHTVALKQDGTVIAWGYDYYGQTNVPAGLPRVTAISAGE